MSTSLSVSSKTNNSVTISGQSNYYGADGDWDWYKNNSFVATTRGTDSNGDGYYNSSYTFSGLSGNTTYTFAVHVWSLSGYDREQGSITVTTNPDPSPPSGTPSVSASAQSGHQIYISWSSVSGATGYDVWANSGSGDYYEGSTSSRSMTITADREYTSYTLKVRPYNSYGNGSTGSTTCRSLDETSPSVSSFVNNSPTSSQCAVSASGYDNSPTSGNSSGMNGFYFYRDGSNVGTVYGSSVNYTFTGLLPNTSYTLGVRAFDNALNTSTMWTSSITTPSNRPASWKWTTACDANGHKISGNDFSMTATEWNNFQTRVNDFRSYKGLSQFSFYSTHNGDNSWTTPTSGGTFYYWFFNQAINAINDMVATGLSQKASMNDVNANDFNILMDKLNSL